MFKLSVFLFLYKIVSYLLSKFYNFSILINSSSTFLLSNDLNSINKLPLFMDPFSLMINLSFFSNIFYLSNNKIKLFLIFSNGIFLRKLLSKTEQINTKSSITRMSNFCFSYLGIPNILSTFSVNIEFSLS